MKQGIEESGREGEEGGGRGREGEEGEEGGREGREREQAILCTTVLLEAIVIVIRCTHVLYMYMYMVISGWFVIIKKPANITSDFTIIIIIALILMRLDGFGTE